MEARLDYSTISPEAMRAMNGLERVVRASSLEPALLELVRLRLLRGHAQQGCPRRHFDEKELVELTLAVVLMNGWNRFGISFRDVPGSYEPEQPVAATP